MKERLSEGRKLSPGPADTRCQGAWSKSHHGQSHVCFRKLSGRLLHTWAYTPHKCTCLICTTCVHPHIPDNTPHVHTRSCVHIPDHTQQRTKTTPLVYFHLNQLMNDPVWKALRDSSCPQHTCVWEHKVSDYIPGHPGIRKTGPRGTEHREGAAGARESDTPVIPSHPASQERGRRDSTESPGQGFSH